MKKLEKAYIILAHTNLVQLIRLIKRLDDNSSTFFIHLDKKNASLNMPALAALKDKIHLVKRINTQWAGYSLVQATLNALEAVRATKKDFAAITLLSGQDYPVKSNQYINDFFSKTDKRIFIEYFEMPNYDKWGEGGGMYRLDKYFFGLKQHQLFLSRSVNFISTYLPFLKRRRLRSLKPFAGSQWWTIDSYALNYILDFIKNKPDYALFHKGSFAPDELFFQTILLNAEDPIIKSSIINDNKRFIRWQSSSLSHPELLQRKDLHDLVHSDALFARKLDLNDDPKLFELIDVGCHSKEYATG